MLREALKKNRKIRSDTSVLGIVAYVSFLISVPVVLGGLWLAWNSGCVPLIHRPFVVVGLVLMVASLVGLVGTCSRQTLLLRIYLLVTFFVVASLLGLVVFTFAVTDYRGDGQVVMNRRFVEYQLSDYRGWLRDRVVDEERWKVISSCLRDGGPNYAGMKKTARNPYTGMLEDETAEMFYSRILTPIQSGCLKPPTSCGFQFFNETYWVMPNPEVITSDSDCSCWNNDQLQLCFDCNSCKAAVLSVVKKKWRKIAILNTVALIILVFTFVAGCTAFRNAKS